MDLSALDNLPSDVSKAPTTSRFKPRARPVARKSAPKPKSVVSEQPSSSEVEAQGRSAEGSAHPSSDGWLSVHHQPSNSAAVNLPAHGSASRQQQEASQPAHLRAAEEGPSAATQPAAKRVRFAKSDVTDQQQQQQQQPDFMLEPSSTSRDASEGLQAGNGTEQPAVPARRGRGSRGRGGATSHSPPTVTSGVEAEQASAGASQEDVPQANDAGQIRSPSGREDQDWDAADEGKARGKRGRVQRGAQGRGKRGRKKYADVAVRQLDRSTATFKQLVEHADARERLKADEEKRMREARGEEGEEEAAAPVGRIRLQDRQAQQPQPAAAAGPSSSALGAPRVFLRDGKMIVDQDSLTVQTQEVQQLGRVVTEEKPTNSHSYANWQKPERWTPEDTDLFYRVMAKFGTDFQTMQKLMPGRSRSQLKGKYRRECKLDPERVDLALKGQEGGAADEWTGVLEILQDAVEPLEGEAGTSEDAASGINRQAVLKLVAPEGLFEGQAAAEGAGDVPPPNSSRARGRGRGRSRGRVRTSRGRGSSRGRSRGDPVPTQDDSGPASREPFTPLSPSSASVAAQSIPDQLPEHLWPVGYPERLHDQLSEQPQPERMSTDSADGSLPRLQQRNLGDQAAGSLAAGLPHHVGSAAHGPMQRLMTDDLASEPAAASSSMVSPTSAAAQGRLLTGQCDPTPPDTQPASEQDPSAAVQSTLGHPQSAPVQQASSLPPTQAVMGDVTATAQADGEQGVMASLEHTQPAERAHGTRAHPADAARGEEPAAAPGQAATEAAEAGAQSATAQELSEEGAVMASEPHDKAPSGLAGAGAQPAATKSKPASASAAPAKPRSAARKGPSRPIPRKPTVRKAPAAKPPPSAPAAAGLKDAASAGAAPHVDDRMASLAEGMTEEELAELENAY
ncbi:hypothetical protein WJX74_007785 [Apatococcus lobatus]|uniref:Myb-like domain-containing protein n=1 Tax=Apatococcus lobatus TaxID=904363 RepID=A0AAW1RZ30_9CHLO